MRLLTDTMRAGMTFAEYIDIFDTLSLDMYYRTDTHWRQETLGETAAAVAAAMGASLPAEYRDRGCVRGVSRRVRRAVRPSCRAGRAAVSHE